MLTTKSMTDCRRNFRAEDSVKSQTRSQNLSHFCNTFGCRKELRERLSVRQSLREAAVERTDEVELALIYDEAVG
jgi:hypothetical protein